jgi:hypothetical protein
MVKCVVSVWTANQCPVSKIAFFETLPIEGEYFAKQVEGTLKYYTVQSVIPIAWENEYYEEPGESHPGYTISGQSRPLHEIVCTKGSVVWDGVWHGERPINILELDGL